MKTFEDELTQLLNRHCKKENGSNTPDFILAAYMRACLDAYDAAVSRRSDWYGSHDKPGSAAGGGR